MRLTIVIPLTLLLCIWHLSPVQAESRTDKAQAEWQKLQELHKTLSAPEYVGRNPDADLDAVKNLPRIREHLDDLEKEFAPEIEDGNQPFRNLGTTITFVRSRLDEFEAAARAFGSPEAIGQDLDHVLKMSKQAIEYQAPAYFQPGNDIQRYTATATVKLRYLEALKPESDQWKAAAKRMADTARQVNELQAGLSALILEQNQLPDDAYQGPDREVLLKRLQEHWAKNGTKAKVLKIGLIGPDWNRSVSWEIQNRTLYKLDRSRMQGYVIVAHDDNVAVRHSINLVKDHLDGDKISAHFLSDPKTPPELGCMLLLDRLK